MASISRFGRAISSGNSASVSNFASSASVSSAVWSSRLANSAATVVIKNSSRSNCGRTIVDGTGFVNSRGAAQGALKVLEKPLIIGRYRPKPVDFGRADRLEPETSILRLVRILLLLLLAVLLLPYLVAPLYRTAHPVSTLMAWRSLKLAPVSRQ